MPVSGFFEWTGPKVSRILHYITRNGSRILAMAGLWSLWREPDGLGAIFTPTILTTAPSRWMSGFHDRMPVFIEQDKIDGWLAGDDGRGLMRSAPDDYLVERIVSQQVNDRRALETMRRLSPRFETPCSE